MAMRTDCNVKCVYGHIDLNGKGIRFEKAASWPEIIKAIQLACKICGNSAATKSVTVEA